MNTLAEFVVECDAHTHLECGCLYATNQSTAASDVGASEPLVVATLAHTGVGLNGTVATATIRAPAKAGLPAVLRSSHGCNGAENDGDRELHCRMY